MSPIDKFAAGQRDALRTVRDRWIATALGDTLTDVPRAEAAIAEIYRVAGLPTPEILWWRSPRALHEAHRKGLQRRTGPSVRGELARAWQPHALRRLSWGMWQQVNAEVRDPVRQRVWRLVGSSVIRAIGPASSTTAPGMLVQYEAGVPALYDYFRTILGLRTETQAIVPLLELTQSVGYMVPFQRVCLVTERAGAAQVDALGRLHAEAGPALAWPDGAALHAWKGRIVPERVIMAPDAIRAGDIDALSQNAEVRRAIIERLGPARYLAEANACLVDADETGRLWLKRFHDGGSWAVVEVVNGTPDPDGSRRTYYLRVPSTVRTARAAVAWTYGLSEEQYASVLRT